MIPKVINYCWFGNNKLTDDVKKCIESWKKFCPDYEIRQWNETNFDVNQNDFLKSAYKEKNWAYVSDYARLKILYENGGIYLDTDVELLQSLDSVIDRGPYLGFEFGFKHDVDVNPGLGFACEPRMQLLKQLIYTYEDTSYDASLSIVERATSILTKNGIYLENSFQNAMGFNIYPTEYFGPMNYYTGQILVTNKTISFHHYSASWTNRLEKYILNIERCGRDKNSIQFKIRRLITLPLRVLNRLHKYLSRG